MEAGSEDTVNGSRIALTGTLETVGVKTGVGATYRCTQQHIQSGPDEV